jgi:hypothetical protein
LLSGKSTVNTDNYKEQFTQPLLGWAMISIAPQAPSNQYKKCVLYEILLLLFTSDRLAGAVTGRVLCVLRSLEPEEQGGL